jgi:hypothetical protein
MAEIYGTRARTHPPPARPSRKERLIVVRTDYGGRRSIGIPGLGMTTAPMEG